MDPLPLLVSVVIPTCRRQDLLHRCLTAVLAQEIPGGRFEVIVVDDGHEDATRQLVSGMQHETRSELIYLRPHAGRGPAVARNCGWRHAQAELVAFTDDDTVPQPGWLAHGVRAMKSAPAYSAVCGRTVVPRLAPAQPPTDHELMTMGLQDAEFITANAFVRRSALERVGGFDERFTRPWREDSDLQFRLAAQAGAVGRCEEAVVFHPVRPERWGVCLRQQRNAFFEALLYQKHPRLYRERIRGFPPASYYAIVVLTAATLAAAAFGAAATALGCAAAAVVLVLQLAWRRLRKTSHEPAHVAEMLATSALIPFLSLYWRARGAWRFRVLFL